MIHVKIQRISNFEYYFGRSTDRGLKMVAAALTFEDPSSFATFQKKTMFNERDHTFGIGMLNYVLEYCARKKHKVEVEDYAYKFKPTDIDKRLTGKFDHQEKAVKAFFERRFGILKVPTRGGKTFIASEIFRQYANEFSGNVLFLVDTDDLFYQAIKDIEGFFEAHGGIKVGRIKGEEIDLSCRITVGTVQTLSSILKRKTKSKKTLERLKALNRFLPTVELLAIDEIHENCSEKRMTMYKKFKNIEFLLCLSATPFRSGAWYQNLKLERWSGGIIYEISEETLKEREVLSDYRVFLLVVDHENIEYDFTGKEDYRDYLMAMIVHSFPRNKAAYDTMILLQRMGLKTLNLFQSLEQGEMFSNHADIPFISGVTKREDRDRAKECLLQSEGGMLSASNIFKKGITLPEVEVLLNVDGGLEDANTVQKKGRVLGWLENKKRSAIIDFIDISELYFSEHSEARLNTYVSSVGEKGVKLYDITSPDWIMELETDLREWFDET